MKSTSLRLFTLVLIMVALTTQALGQATHEDFKLTTSDAVGGDQFGKGIAIDGNTIVIGARYNEDAGHHSGSAYLFDANTGTELFKLLPSDGDVDDYFGYAVGIANNLVAVGSYQDDEGGYNTGSVYLFDGTTGLQLGKLTAPDGASIDAFGYSVAIDSEYIVVGAVADNDNGESSGSIYIFDAITRTFLRKIITSDGERYDQFGQCLAIENGVIAVGCIGDDDNGSSSGSAYLFEISTGDLIAKLIPNDGTAGDKFGWSIDISNGQVIVGAPEDDSDAGAAYLFDAATGNQISKIVPETRVANDEFGVSVAMDNGMIAVGADRSDDSGDRFGAAFLFNAGTGVQINRFRASDGETNSYFGGTIAIDNGTLVVGSDADDAFGFASGAAYVYEVGGEDTAVMPQAGVGLTLFANHPNPFNPSTTISFEIENDGYVELAVYSVRGDRVRTLVNEWRSSGLVNSVVWDGRDEQGFMLASGVYYAQVQSGGSVAMQKMVLLK